MKKIKETKNGGSIYVFMNDEDSQAYELKVAEEEDKKIKAKDKNATQAQKLDYVIALLEKVVEKYGL